MSFDVGSLGDLYPWTPRQHRLPDGQTMSYLDVGQGEKTLLCVHGNPTWSFLWRDVVKAFEGDYRVVVPDHIGAGLSSKPQHYPYTLATHVANIDDLTRSLNLRDVTLVVHDWGGAIGAGWALQNLERVERVVVTNTSWFRSERIPFSINICRIPGFGALAIRGLNAFARAAVIRAARTTLHPKVVDGFVGPYDSWQSRVGHLRFVEDIPMHDGIASWAPLVEIEEGLAQLEPLPMLICWGMKDFCFNHTFLAKFEQRFPQAEIHRFDEAGHYLLEDAGPEVIQLMRDFLARTQTSRLVGSAR